MVTGCFCMLGAVRLSWRVIPYGLRRWSGLRRRRPAQLSNSSRLAESELNMYFLFHPLDPLRAPDRRREGICKILCFMHHLAVSELHDTHREGRLPLVSDYVLADPEISPAQHAPNLKTGRFGWMIGAEPLDVPTSTDALA